MAELFDYINSINNKDYIFEEGAKNYNQFMVNKFFMHFPDTLYIINELNSRTLSDKMHYDFLYNVIDKKKRFTKWYKEESNKDLEIVMQYYDVNEKTALDYIKLLGAEELQSMKAELSKGGNK